MKKELLEILILEKKYNEALNTLEDILKIAEKTENIEIGERVAKYMSFIQTINLELKNYDKL